MVANLAVKSLNRAKMGLFFVLFLSCTKSIDDPDGLMNEGSHSFFPS